MTTRTTAAAGAVLLAGIAALSAGCGARTVHVLEFQNIEAVGITAIRMTGGGGDVVVNTSDRTDTQVDRKVNYQTPAPPDTTYRIDGSTLVIDTDCGSWCDVDWTISAPRGVTVSGSNSSGDVTLTAVGAVDLEVASGSITATGVAGTIRAHAESGEVTVADVTGKADLSAESGEVTGRGLAGPVTATAQSGSINLTLTQVASVTASAESGELTVRVPDGSYRVRVAADSGDLDVGVPNDPAAGTVLDLRTESGDLRLLSA
ncbi:DUF4097 family beta strand repeat-containing protein [Catenuloplanes japonicus]|uniref:DUF4097 family beta strand repeat-containing protein n=1 Tax=Catenuloplanes japonicus TaxID=33876 RepID=UPI000691981F|nr:DUF4097 family beta strand repeat-containing protein [Catenuloplanes japonicus]